MRCALSVPCGRKRLEWPSNDCIVRSELRGGVSLLREHELEPGQCTGIVVTMTAVAVQVAKRRTRDGDVAAMRGGCSVTRGRLRSCPLATRFDKFA